MVRARGHQDRWGGWHTLPHHANERRGISGWLNPATPTQTNVVEFPGAYPAGAPPAAPGHLSARRPIFSGFVNHRSQLIC
jgi:hypothetical protein